MKLINKFVDRFGVGHVTLRPEDDEDMWHLYNLIQEVSKTLGVDGILTDLECPG